MRLFIFFFLLPAWVMAQNYSERLALEKGEAWWGGRIKEAAQMPFQPGYEVDLNFNNANQVQPLLISNKGRYIWNEGSFRFKMTKDELILEGGEQPFVVGRSGESLRSAYQYAARTFFPFQGEMPHPRLFNVPQYNSWIELIYNQNQADIMNYARSIVREGFPTGVLMIDDNWQIDYGDWNFKPDRFPDPKGMVDSLHQMGFEVMLWVCPFVSPDSETFRYLYEQKDAFLKDPARPEEAKMVRWWNGFSALLDFTNPAAVTWFKGELTRLQETYGIDGFKLDAGDFPFYHDCLSHKKASPQEHSRLYAALGLDYPLNEYRACWKMGGRGLVQRLADKNFSWEDLQQLIPGITLQGLMGYPFACPDMIGGGEYRSFLALDSIDQELIVRSTQVHAYMPMMQFSVAPWRVLDAKHLAACLEAAKVHAQIGQHILDIARESSKSGEPIVRTLDYAFPGEGYEEVKDQFLLGYNMMIAPVLESGARSRKVQLPPGKWWDHTGRLHQGPQQIEVDAPLDVIPVFRYGGQ